MIFKNHAVIILDPHGDLAEDAIKTIPQGRLKDLVILDPSNLEYPLAVNPLELLPDENPSLKASATTEIFQMLAKGSWGPRLEYILRNAILTLLLNKNTSLLDLPRLLTEKEFCLKNRRHKRHRTHPILAKRISQSRRKNTPRTHRTNLKQSRTTSHFPNP